MIIIFRGAYYAKVVDDSFTPVFKLRLAVLALASCKLLINSHSYYMFKSSLDSDLAIH